MTPQETEATTRMARRMVRRPADLVCDDDWWALGALLLALLLIAGMFCAPDAVWEMLDRLGQ
jgi:hypothetical protein